MLEQFIQFITKHSLFSKQDRILVGVSGGIDSVVLADLFQRAGYKFGIAHCNFQLRGTEAKEDERFVQELAKDKYQVPFHSISFHTSSYAERLGISVQMAARRLRYDWLEEIRTQNKYHYIAIAHHQGDTIETFFINLLRGTGISGLQGIPIRNGLIVRPLLFATRQHIEHYATEQGIIHREDSSNASTKYLRNQIRHELLPVLKHIHPEAESIIIQNIERLKDAGELYHQSIEIAEKQVCYFQKDAYHIDLERLSKLSPLKTYLFEFIAPFGFSGHQAEAIIETFFTSSSGKQFYSSTHRLIKNREELIIERLHPSKKDDCYLIPKGTTQITEPFMLNIDGFAYDSEQSFSTEKNIACLDLSHIQFPITLRRWKPGDTFIPLGMRGQKKISDFLVDNKVSLTDKDQTWVLESNGDIIWVVGMRISDKYKITSKTRFVLRFEYPE